MATVRRYAYIHMLVDDEIKHFTIKKRSQRKRAKDAKHQCFLQKIFTV
jgi:hypothetical protein